MTRSSRAAHRAVIQARASKIAGPLARVQATRSDSDSDGGAVSAELWLYGTVGGYWWGFNAETVADALREIGEVAELRVRVHSPGGNAFDGIAIGNLLRNHPARVLVVVDGIAASAASVIALAGDEVVMSPGSQMMIHDAWMCTCGNAAELRSDADWIDQQSQNYAGVYAHRAGGTAAEWRERMLADGGRGTWYTADAAVEIGLADRVGTVVATGTPPADPSEDSDLEPDDIAARAAWDLEVLVHPDVRAAWSGPKPPTASAGGSTKTEGRETAVAFTPEQITGLRATLGLPETADEAAIVAAVSAVVEESLEENPSTNAAVPDGMTLIDTETLASLRAGAEDGRSAREQQRTETRDRTIAAAIKAGKITPARRDHYAAMYDADPEGTRDLLENKLEAGLVPVEEEAGHAQTSEGSPLAMDDEALEAYASQMGLDKEDLR